MQRTVSMIVVSLFAAAPLAGQSYYRDRELEPSQTAFGSSIAIGDDEIFVGEAGNEYGPGVVYVYRPDPAGTWIEAAAITASDGTPGDGFGAQIAVDGATMLVASGSGVYVFEKDDAERWTEATRLMSSGQEANGFGAAMALSGATAFIGTPGANGGVGAVFVYRRDDGGGWSETDMLWSRDIGQGATFGLAIAATADQVFVGAPRHNNRAGAVFVFTHDGTTWHDAGTLQRADAGFNTVFGASVTLVGETLVVGVPGVNQFTGAVDLFQRTETTGQWDRVAVLEPEGLASPAGFGLTMASSETELWIGAPFTSEFTGLVRRFARSDVGEWVPVGAVETHGVQAGDNFGAAIALGRDVAVIAAPGADYGEGTARIFQRAEGSWVDLTEIMSEGYRLDPVIGGEVDCVDGTSAGYACGEMDLVAFLPVSALGGDRGVNVNDVWGWVDPETGREYALVGRTEGTAFVDITDPARPVLVGSLPMPAGANWSVWRDIKVFANHAFIVADGAGPHGMQVFDLTQLRAVANPPVTFLETARYDGIFSAHNVVINEETGFAYSVGSAQGGNTCGGGLHMIDIRDPANPTFAGCFAHQNTGRRGTGYTHDAQCVVYHGPDQEHGGKEICFGANETALSIADVTEKDAPVALAVASYPNVGYSHQGWLTEDHRYFYMNDELDELSGDLPPGTRTLIWDVSDLDDPILAKEHHAENRASDHNLYVRGTLMYQANYQSGLRVLDIVDPENPMEVGFFDTVPRGEDEPGMDGAWSSYPFFPSGVIAITSKREGLFLVKQRERQVIP